MSVCVFLFLFVFFFVQASGVGGLLRAHHHYLDTILFGALLTPKARPVLDVVEVLLSCVVALRAQLELVSATQETGGGWTGEQYARLMDTRETFRSGVAFLFKGRSLCVCVYVCMCEREREGAKKVFGTQSTFVCM